MEALTAIFETVSSLGWFDALDILLVALMVYGVITLLRRTRGAPMAIGIIAFVLLRWIAVALELQTVGTLLELAMTTLPFVVVLLFQNSIRRALLSMGRNPLFRLFAPHEEESLVEAISLAVLSLRSKRIGAIIAVEREIGLRNYSASGIPIDAVVSYELLVALFQTKSPLHDGAVIISGGRIAAAACMLPLTTKPQLSVRYGSRHRAGIGLSEETDSIVIVVSEERGTLAVIEDGEIRTIEAKELRDLLAKELGVEPSEKPGRPQVASI
jgi:diadenylate cyclase